MILKEVMVMLESYYSAEEIVDIVEPDTGELVKGLEDSITANWDRILDRLEEDGYYENI